MPSEGALISYHDMDLIKFIKFERVRWAGHVVRMNESETPPKKLVTEVIHRTRRMRKPRTRWLNGVAADSRQRLDTRKRP